MTDQKEIEVELKVKFIKTWMGFEIFYCEEGWPKKSSWGCVFPDASVVVFRNQILSKIWLVYYHEVFHVLQYKLFKDRMVKAYDFFPYVLNPFEISAYIVGAIFGLMQILFFWTFPWREVLQEIKKLRN